MMKKPIVLKPVEMTPAIMEYLEKRNLIIRLGPSRHELPAEWGEARERPVYDSHEQYGPHRLLTVTVNRCSFAEFATHPDNEEFLLVGDPNAKPLFLVIALMYRKELEEKILRGTLVPDDFVCLRIRWNDPEVSFFTMLAGVPHGETVTIRDGRPPSFYVAESRDLPNDVVDFGCYELVVSG
jgi:hypothetical protein